MTSFFNQTEMFRNKIQAHNFFIINMNNTTIVTFNDIIIMILIIVIFSQFLIYLQQKQQGGRKGLQLCFFISIFFCNSGQWKFFV